MTCEACLNQVEWREDVRDLTNITHRYSSPVLTVGESTLDNCLNTTARVNLKIAGKIYHKTTNNCNDPKEYDSTAEQYQEKKGCSGFLIPNWYFTFVRIHNDLIWEQGDRALCYLGQKEL